MSAVHKYYRKISENVDNIKNSIDITSLLIKSQEVDLKIKDIENNNNENLTLIQTKIDNIENDIENINTKVANNYNISQINKKNIDFKTGIIDNQISAINSTLNDLKNKNNSKYSIENYFIYNIEIENTYTFDSNNSNFSIFNYDLDDDFKKDSILEVNTKLLYDYSGYNNIGKSIHNYKLYDSENNLLYQYLTIKTNGGDNFRDELIQGDTFYVKLDKDYIKIKIELILAIKQGVSGSVTCKLYNTFNSNYLCVKYIKKNYI